MGIIGTHWVICKYAKPHLFLSMHNPNPICVANYYSIFLQSISTTLNKDRVMNNASINGYAIEASPARLPFKNHHALDETVKMFS